MLASDLIKSYESFCPPELSMEGDVVGLQIGSLDKEIQKVMVQNLLNGLNFFFKNCTVILIGKGNRPQGNL